MIFTCRNWKIPPIEPAEQVAGRSEKSMVGGL